jgi:hypothetical protein
MEDGHQFLHQEDTIIEGAIIKLFEEALGLRVSPNYGERCGTTEERHATLRWHEEYTEFVHAVHQTARTHGRATRSTMMLNSFIRSTTIHPEVFQWMYHEDRRRRRGVFVLRRGSSQILISMTPSKCWILLKS